MPYKRKRSSKPRWSSLKKVKRFRTRRTGRVGRKILSINRNPISYTREIPLNNVTIPTGQNWVTFGAAFNIAQLPNILDFTSLFDVYRIRCIVAKFRLVQPPEASNTPATSQFYPDIYMAVDHDDAAQPTNPEVVLQYGKCKRAVLKPNRWVKYRFYPTTSVQLYRSATTTGYAPMKNGTWLDLAQTDTPYYGLKVAISNEAAGVTTAPLNIEWHLTMVAQFKSSR